MIFQLVVVGLAILGTAAPQSSGDHYEDHHHEEHHDDHHEHHEEHHEEHYHEPHYKFEYEVKDKHTGDYKHHKESRKGDDVEGYYSLIEPDGTLREVHYTSAKHAGFHAVVTHSGKPIDDHHEEKHEEEQHHDEPKVHYQVLDHHEEIKHHEPKYHHEEIKHHEPEQHYQNIEHHHEPKHLGHQEFSGNNGEFGSPNAPVPSKLKYQSKNKGKKYHNMHPYSVHENIKERKGYSYY